MESKQLLGEIVINTSFSIMLTAKGKKSISLDFSSIIFDQIWWYNELMDIDGQSIQIDEQSIQIDKSLSKFRSQEKTWKCLIWLSL